MLVSSPVALCVLVSLAPSTTSAAPETQGGIVYIHVKVSGGNGNAAENAASLLFDADADSAIPEKKNTMLRSTPADHAKGILTPGSQVCKVMNWYNWNDIKYACQWNHEYLGYHLYYMRYDGTFIYECECEDTLGKSYGSFPSIWTWTKTDGVGCFTKDGKSYDEVAHLFGQVSCTQPQKNCDTRKPEAERCAYFKNFHPNGRQ